MPFVDQVLVYKDDEGTKVVYVPANMFDPNSRERQQLLKAGILGKINKSKITTVNGDVEEIEEIEHATDIQVWMHIAERSIPPNTQFISTHISNIPSDREFRSAWSLSGESLSVDLKKAKDIKMAKIREKRNKKLAETDEQLLKAIESGADTTQIKKKRQDLRDVPQKIDLSSINSVEDLKKLSPKELE